MPVSGSYSIVTGGQTYTEFFYSLGIPIFVNTVNTTDTSLTIYEDTVQDGNDTFGGTLPDFVASNGMEVGFGTKDPSDGATYYGWKMDNLIATVPEPSTFAVLGFGLEGCALFRRRKTNRA